ncbi:MAG: hypothetical protein AAFX99_23700 [Myxococcota bacterium]
MSGSDLFVIDVNTGDRLGPFQGDKGDVDFPAQVRGWSDVLDCRHHPYADMKLDTLRHYAHHVHKFFLLVESDFLTSQTGAVPLEIDEQQA